MINSRVSLFGAPVFVGVIRLRFVHILRSVSRIIRRLCSQTAGDAVLEIFIRIRIRLEQIRQDFADALCRNLLNKNAKIKIALSNCGYTRRFINTR